jgi:hypothetical protein
MATVDEPSAEEARQLARRQRNNRLARDRAFAIGVSNLLLMGVMALALRHGYADYRATYFYVIEASVVATCIALNPDRWWETLTSFKSGLERPLGDPEDDVTNGQSLASERPRRASSLWVVDYRWAFPILFAVIVANFYAVGRLVNATGGITASPFIAYAVSMIVLGLIMSIERRTMRVILLLGIAYTIVLSFTHIFGDPNPNAAKSVAPDTLRNHYALVTAVSLLISYFVTRVARPVRRVIAIPTTGTTGLKQFRILLESGQAAMTSAQVDILRAGGDPASSDPFERGRWASARREAVGRLRAWVAQFDALVGAETAIEIDQRPLSQSTPSWAVGLAEVWTSAQRRAEWLADQLEL